ncbi:uncharacterized protein C227.17c isoform X3 [Dendrobium catenatum]|uniref:uncharacterized protein C227.17c isoform X3 n=1 Tax=Dendrobium catenatum TaxID=906689 RepID=UPI0009F3155E|nr:uncharacterized protein C227.17c isoform X3 [Dendrobium catenatum]
MIPAAQEAAAARNRRHLAFPAPNTSTLCGFVIMEQYYRYGHFDSCSGKWSSLFDCLSLKTKRPDEVEKILQAREKSKSHIWTYRTVEEASENWWRMYHHLFDKSDTKPKPDA